MERKEIVVKIVMCVERLKNSSISTKRRKRREDKCCHQRSNDGTGAQVIREEKATVQGRKQQRNIE